MRKTDLLFAVTIIILALLLMRSRDQQRSAQALYDATQDTLKVRTNALGQQTASISVLKAASKKQFLKFKTQDSTIVQLQDVVKEYKGKLATATVLSNATADVGTTATTITKTDTVVVNNVSYIYQTYDTKWDEKWSKGTIVATRDTITRDIKIKNEYEITQGEERQGLFKPRILTVNVKNLNPNTETEEFRTFTVDVPKKRFNFGVQGGYGLLIGANGLSTGFYAGAGLSWTILKF